jgi:hypothetical protein
VRLAWTAPLAVALLLVSRRAAADDQLSVKVALGGDYRNLYGVPVYGGDAHVALGIRTALVDVYGMAGFTVGETPYGLTTTIYELGCSFERRFGALALGLPVRPSYIRISRVTTSGALDSIGIGVGPFVGVDLFSSQGHAIFLAASMNLDEYIVGSSTFAWGPTLSIGYRDEE